MNERQGPRAIWRESASREYFCVRVREIEKQRDDEGKKGEQGREERGEERDQRRDEEHATADWTMTAKSMAS